MKITGNCSRLRQRIYQLLNAKRWRKPRTLAFTKTTKTKTPNKLWNVFMWSFDTSHLNSQQSWDNSVCTALPKCLHNVFLKFSYVCNQAVCSRVRVWAHLTFVSNAYEDVTDFHLPSLLPSLNMAELPLPHFLCMWWNICLLSLFTERLKWSFPYWWQAITHTLTSCTLGNTEGGSLSKLSSLHCCLFYSTVCGDRHSYTLNCMFLEFLCVLLGNGNSWCRS